MKSIDFVNAALADTGNHVLWLLRKGQHKNTSWNENHSTFSGLLSAIKTHDKKPDVSVYIALGSFDNNVGVHPTTERNYVQRKGAQATYFKSLACDLDVEPNNEAKYSTQIEALAGIINGCKALSLPVPTLVLSGTGVHAWWFLDTPIRADLWANLSLGLAEALRSQGVRYDPSKISDTTMVLRPISSHHKKNPNAWQEVRVFKEGAVSSPLHLAEVLKPHLASSKKEKGPGQLRKHERQQSAILDAILDGGTPVHVEDLNQCRQLAPIIASNGALDAIGEAVSEPMWRATLGVAAFCDDKHAAAVVFSKGHPDYEEQACMDKVDRWRGTGPTVCTTFERLCEGGCGGCPFQGKITSPAQLTSGMSTIKVTHIDEGAQETTTTDEELPTGYTLKGSCIYYRDRKTNEDILVSPYPLWITRRVVDADTSINTAQIAAKFPLDGIQTFDIPSATIASGGKELYKALADNSIYIRSDLSPIRNYLMTYLSKLQRQKRADTVHSHYGWQKDGSFLLGNRLIGAPPEVVPGLTGLAREYAEAMEPKGSLEAWTTTSKLFARAGMESQNFAASLALGAPIMAGSGIESAILNLYSGDSGSGKTLTGKFGLAAWGDPRMLMRKTKDSEASLYKFISTMGNQAGYIDEMTTGEAEFIKRVTLTLQDGREKERVTKEADGFRPVGRWCMPVIMSSNKDMHEMLTNLTPTEAEHLRMLQLKCPRTALFEAEGTKLGRTVDMILRNNYGHAGAIIVGDIIARGGPERVYHEALEQFETIYGFQFQGEERFYMVIIITAHCGGEIARRLGLIKYDYQTGIRAALREVEHLRQYRKETTYDGIDKLGQFLTENQDRIVHYHVYPGSARALDPLPRAAIARTEVTMDDSKRVLQAYTYVGQAEFRRWLRQRGLESRATIEDMQNLGVTVEPNLRKVLFKGVPGASSSGQVRCFGIDMMSHSRLIEAVDSGFDGIKHGKQRLELVTNG